MAPDDRDRMFDKALSRHLRSGDSSSALTNLSFDSAAGSSSCFDPETLAAYHERSLLPEEMSSAKEHIVGCARCQAILAQLELTDSIPLAAAEKEEALGPAAALAAAKREKPAPRPIRGPRWAWLVPAGALAAGLLVWIGLHENQRPHLLNTREVQVAKNQEAPATVPSLEKQPQPTLTAPKQEQLDVLARKQGVVGGVAGDAAKAVPTHQEALKLPTRTDSGSRVAGAPVSVAKEAETSKDAARDSSAALTAAMSQADLDAKGAAAGAPQDRNALQNQAALNQNVNIVAQNQALQQKVAGPSPLGQMSQAEVAKKAKAAPALSRSSAAAAPSAPVPVPSEAAAFAGNVSLERRAIPNQHLIAVPGSPVRWLAGGAGLIEFSSDSGTSWSVQTSGVTVDLLTGSAPSEKICWMVGRAGTILLTTDGGAHWSTVPSPLTEDLGGIRAFDALHATVWNLAKTKWFETTDGGATWKPVAAQ